MLILTKIFFYRNTHDHKNVSCAQQQSPSCGMCHSGEKEKKCLKGMHARIFAKQLILCLDNDLPEEVSAEKIFLSDIGSKKKENHPWGTVPT